MSRTFSDSLTSDLSDVFFNTGEWAEAFTLSRGALSTSGVACITATRDYEAVDTEGVTTTTRAVDFDLPASAYMIGGVEVEPQRGDRFTADGKVYEVMPPPGRPAWEPTGPGGAVIRVHTKRIS